MMKNLRKQIRQKTNEEDLAGLDELYKKVIAAGSDSDNIKTKKFLSKGYQTVFDQWIYDLYCDKLNYPEAGKDLLGIIEKIKTLTPPYRIYHLERGTVFSLTASSQKGKRQKNLLKRSVSEHRLYLDENPKKAQAVIRYAQALQELNLTAKKPKRSSWKVVKKLLLKALKLKYARKKKFGAYDGTAINLYIRIAFEARAVFKKSSEIYREFMDDFEKLMIPYAEKKPVLYYYWIGTLLKDGYQYDDPENRNSHSDFKKLPPKIKEKINTLLPKIYHLYSTDDQLLTNVGHLFTSLGKAVKSHSHLKVALNYFLQALALVPTSWTNPHYATQVLEEQRKIYLSDGKAKKANKLLTSGLKIYQQSEKHISNFQFSYYYGLLLYDYAERMEDFKNKKTLKKAQHQFGIARELGGDYYTIPFYGLALTALQLGDKVKCMDILQKCRTVFTTEYYTYTFEEILNGGDDRYIPLLSFVERILGEKGKF